MRKTWASAARAAEVRSAASSWREAGIIDAETLEAVRVAYPDTTHPVSTPWTVLIFFVVSVALNAAFFGAYELTGTNAEWPVLVFGLILAAVTEGLRGSRFAGNGSDAAASFWAILYVLVGAALHWEGGSLELTFFLGLGVVAFTAACVHWGFSVYGVLAAVCLFGLLARFPGGRLYWVLAAGILLPAAHGGFDRAALAPPHRRSLAGVFAAASVALYVAVNSVSIDERWIEQLQQPSFARTSPADWVVALSALATALLPAVFLSWGLRTRRTLVLDLGLLFTAASLVTLRHYVHLAPLWALLTLCGAALVLGALWLDRWLKRAPGGERRGFTAAPLFSTRRAESLQAGAILAGFAATAPAAKESAADFSPGGGRYGGGGASGEY